MNPHHATGTQNMFAEAVERKVSQVIQSLKEQPLGSSRPDTVSLKVRLVA